MMHASCSWFSLLMVCLSVLTGCGQEVAYQVDGAFSPEQASEIDRAARTWNSHGTQLRRVHRRLEADYYVISARNPTGTRGLYQEQRGLIRIDLEATPDDFVYCVALHEFGHVLLGTQHVDVPGAVMHSAEANCELTRSDLDECRRAGACD